MTLRESAYEKVVAVVSKLKDLLLQYDEMVDEVIPKSPFSSEHTPPLPDIEAFEQLERISQELRTAQQELHDALDFYIRAIR